MNENIGIVGFGNMGASIAGQLKLKKNKFQVFAFDKDREKLKKAEGISIASDNIELVNKSDIVLLAVKPQDFEALLKEIKNYAKDKLIISIAAGINTAYIEDILGKARVTRAMPNIGAKIGESVTCFCKGAYTTYNDLALAKELFLSFGAAKQIDEEMMNASTAISGSGPAYIYDDIETNNLDPLNISEQKKQYYIERLIEAAESLGFNSEDAKFLAGNTTNCSLNLIIKTKTPPAELKKQVTSKGGTTEAALKALHKTGSWEMAAKAALKRAEELAKGE